MRTLALLIGIVLIGKAEAVALNAAPAVDSDTIDAGRDLFASKPASPAPVAKPAASAPPPAVAMPSTSERVHSGNPLWAIPLTNLTATREQPLFAPSRRPPPVAAVAKPAAAPPAPPPKPPEPEKPQLSLLGTVAGTGQRIGLFLDSASKAVLRLKAGENHHGWTLSVVRPRQVELAKGLDNAVLDLPRPDVTAGAAAPMAPSTAGMLASPSPASPGIPLSTAKATGTIPRVTPAGTPGQQPPAPNQPPAAPNPFLRVQPH